MPRMNGRALAGALVRVFALIDDQERIVTGTDLEIELEARARVQNLAPGRATIPARKLFDICRGLPEGAEIVLEVGADKAALQKAMTSMTDYDVGGFRINLRPGLRDPLAQDWRT